MSNARATIQGYMAAAKECEEEVEDLDYKIRDLKKELHRLEALRVGALEATRQAHDLVRRAKMSEVNDEVSNREVEIAAMKGLDFILGQPFTDHMKALLRNTPPLPRFRSDSID